MSVTHFYQTINKGMILLHFPSRNRIRVIRKRRPIWRPLGGRVVSLKRFSSWLGSMVVTQHLVFRGLAFEVSKERVVAHVAVSAACMESGSFGCLLHLLNSRSACVTTEEAEVRKARGKHGSATQLCHQRPKICLEWSWFRGDCSASTYWYHRSLGRSAFDIGFCRAGLFLIREFGLSSPQCPKGLTLSEVKQRPGADAIWGACHASQ